MFRPAECFKAAIACPIVAYVVGLGFPEEFPAQGRPASRWWFRS